MIRGKDLTKHFKTAPWTSQQEVDAFVAAAGEVPAADLLRIVPLLTDRGLRASATAHQGRCAAFVGLVEKAPSPELFVPLVKAMDKADQTLLAATVAALPLVNNVSAHPRAVAGHR